MYSEKRKKYLQNYYQKNKAKMRDRNRLWKRDNPDRVKEYRENEREKQREYQRNWRKANPEKFRFWDKQRKHRLRGVIGSHTLQEWLNLKAQHNNSCLKCEEQEPLIELTEDHIIPLISGGTNFIENIQPLCRSCNCKKGSKIPL